MDKKECMKLLRKAKRLSRDDPEAAHGNADEILCKLLESLGYKDVVELYHSIEKWYT